MQDSSPIRTACSHWFKELCEKKQIFQRYIPKSKIYRCSNYTPSLRRSRPHLHLSVPPGASVKNLLILLALSTTLAAQTKPLTIEAIFADGGLTGRAPEAFQWSPDDTSLTFVQRDDSGEHGELWSIDAATGEKHVLVSEVALSRLSPPLSKIQDEREKERLSRYGVAAYQWAPDSKHILFDSHGQLWFYSLDTGTAVQFTASPDPSSDPKFSPNGKSVSYVRQHNLYVQSVDGQKEKQVTQKEREKDGKGKKEQNATSSDDDVLNGEVDWVYEEELSVRSNQFWSPDSRRIAFLQMDESRVPSYPITDWMPTHPHVDKEKYPKVGDPNPTVRLGVLDAGNGKFKWITPFTENEAPGLYVPRFGWVNKDVVWAQVLNRRQNQIDLYFIDAGSGRSRKVLTETSDAWIDVNDVFRILKSSPNDSSRFLWSSWRDGHTHLYLYSFSSRDPLAADARLERQLTQGDYEVLAVEAVTESTNDSTASVLFTANKDDARQQHVYAVQLDGSGLRQVVSGAGTEHAEFSGDGQHFMSSVSSILQPDTKSICSLNGTCKKFWEPRSVSDYALAEPKDIDFPAEDGTPLHGQLLLPANAPAKVPLLIYIYGGPAGQTVTDSWGGSTSLFHQLLVQHGFAVFTLDNRGSPNRGKKFSAAIKGEFGAVELRDQLGALNDLLAKFPQLDKDRMAIWGWSNGASMTLYAMTHSTVFRAGVAVAPVTDQHNYDSIYTERYMGQLADNGKGYDDSATPKSAANLYGSLLLVHGTSDDNVHFQNSIQMIDALIKAGKQFDLMIYPNKTHGISGPAARTHLFHAIENHLTRELMPAKNQ
jgi:dipeptidyl-peptidase 4